MAIPLSSQFHLSAQLPLDDRDIKADSTARNAIDLVQRYFGLKVTLLSDGSTWMLADAAMGGVDSDLSNNANWIPAGGYTPPTGADFIIARTSGRISNPTPLILTQETWLGELAGDNGSTLNTTYLGARAGQDATNAQGAVFVGIGAGANATDAERSLFIGSGAGASAINARDSVFIGNSAANNATNAANSIFIGTDAGNGDTVDNTISGHSILLGDATSTGGFSDSIAIGTSATNTKTDQFLVEASYINWQIAGVDYVMPSAMAAGTYYALVDLVGDGVLSWQPVAPGVSGADYLIGETSGRVSNPTTLTGDGEVWLGHGIIGSTASKQKTTFIGLNAGSDMSGGDNAVAVGWGAGANAANASQSVFLGAAAGQNAPDAKNSIFIGVNAGLNDTVVNTGTDTSILIGVQTSTGGFKNSIAMGYLGTNSAENQFLIAPSYNWLEMGNVATGNYFVLKESTHESTISISDASTISTVNVLVSSVQNTTQDLAGTYVATYQAGSTRTALVYNDITGGHTNTVFSDATSSSMFSTDAATNVSGEMFTTAASVQGTVQESSVFQSRMRLDGSAAELLYNNLADTTIASFKAEDGIATLSFTNAATEKWGVKAEDGKLQFLVDDGANAYVDQWPNTQAAGYLSNDGTGVLSWVTGTDFLWGQTSGLVSNPSTVGMTTETWLGHFSGVGASTTGTTFIGYNSGNAAASANNSVFIGTAAGDQAVSAANSVFIGVNAGGNSPNSQNAIYIGAGTGNTSPINTTFGGSSIIIGSGGLEDNAAAKNGVGIGDGVRILAAKQFIVDQPTNRFTDIALESVGTVRLGDFLNAADSTLLTLSDPDQSLSFDSNGDNYLFFDLPNGTFKIGYTTGVQDGLQMLLTDHTSATKWEINSDLGRGILADFDGLDFEFGIPTATPTVTLTGANQQANIDTMVGGAANLNLDGVAGTSILGDFGAQGNNTIITADDAKQAIIVNKRFEEKQGGNATAANDLVLGFGNAFPVTGNTTINAIDATDWQNGSQITLIFTGTPTVKHNTTGGTGTVPMLLAGSADLTAALNTVLGLVLVETPGGQFWQETFRKVA